MQPVADLLAVWRRRLAAPMEDRESVVVGTLALGYVAAAAVLLLALPAGREADPLVVPALFAAYVGVSRIRFEVGAGYVSAEQLAFVPLLFLVPLPLVLLLVPVAFALSDLPDILAGRAHRDRWMNALADSWFVLGSVSVLGLLAPGPPALELAPVYALALAAQVGMGTAAALAREHFVGRLALRDELRSAAAAYQLDVLLSPVGFAVACAATAWGPLALASLVPAAAATYALSRAHGTRCDRLVAEHEAYWHRFLSDARRLELGGRDAVSSDWRSMPELALAVGAELGLTTAERTELAQAAQAAARTVLLDDVRAERRVLAAERRLRLAVAVIEGRLCQAGVADLVPESDLDRLRRQADVVRLSRERFDGARAPYGLHGELIPLAARVIACCDAYSAMTSGRLHRIPMSAEIALEELRRGAGSRFDPKVVAALGHALARQEDTVPRPSRSPWLLDSLRSSVPAWAAGARGAG